MSDASANEPRDPARERLVKVASFDNVVDAQLASDQLERAGIRSAVKNVDALSAYQTAALPLALDLYVLEGDAEAAVELLAQEPEAPPPVHHHVHRRRPRR